MGYVLNEESMDIVKLARDFEEKEVAPVCAEYDKKGEFPMALYQKLLNGASRHWKFRKSTVEADLITTQYAQYMKNLQELTPGSVQVLPQPGWL